MRSPLDHRGAEHLGECLANRHHVSDLTPGIPCESKECLRATIHLLHVYQLPVFALPDSSVTVSPTYVADLTDRAQKALNKHKEALIEKGIGADAKLLEGMPAQSIVDHADEVDADMIVMGTHGRSGFKRFLLGSTTERVVRTATTPVLTVHLPE